MKCNVEVLCPFDSCQKKYSKVSSFSAHLTRCHYALKNMPSSCDLGNHFEIIDANQQSAENITFQGVSLLNEGPVFQSPTTSVNMERELVLFYGMLQHKDLVAASTVKAISDHFRSLLAKSNMHLIDQLSSALKSAGVTEIVAANVVQELQNSSLSAPCSYFESTLRSQYTRTLCLRHNFSFISPVAMNLQCKEDLTETFSSQYVLIFESLQALFNHKAVRYQFLNPTNVSCTTANMFKDFKDGLVFQSNPLFNSGAKTIQIVFFIRMCLKLQIPSVLVRASICY